ncbi:MAG: hypothetical protein V1925_01155 [Candidatus Omnitrophota bacterium]
MIVPMKRITVILQAKDADSAMKRLRSLGILHLEHQEAPRGKNITVLREEAAAVSKALGVLSEAQIREKPLSPPARKIKIKDWRFTAGHIIELRKRLDHLQEYSKALINNIAQWQGWGDFEPEKIIALKRQNVFIKFYQIPAKEIAVLPQGLILKKISLKGGVVNCMVIMREDTALPYKEAALPKMGISQMRAKLAEDAKVMQWLKKDIQKHIFCRDGLAKVRDALERELEFEQALSGMAKFDNITYLAGYTPYDKTGLVTTAARSQRWGISVVDPLPEERVPTLIRNPRWVSIISPVFKIIEVVPGYRELDISLWFLIFFSIFFGILIGDAGYGAVFFMMTFAAQLKLGGRVKQKAIFTLFYILSSCAIVWGVLSGTFFGQEWLPQWVRPVIPALRNDRSVQAFCFLLGALHLSIAHCWRGIVKLPSPKALADVGWVLILWGAYFLAKLLILADAYPLLANRLFIAGAILVVLFTNPRKNLLKGVAAGMGNLLLNLIGNFTDIVSYIRLFAVGLATVAVADTFNKMAFEVGYNSFLTGLFSSLILLLGHTLNILLGPMAILVHGVRLNVLEFCNHLDIKWSGFAYNPLRESRTVPEGDCP